MICRFCGGRKRAPEGGPCPACANEAAEKPEDVEVRVAKLEERIAKLEAKKAPKG